MDEATFDRLARALSTILSRRGIMAVVGAVFGFKGQRVVRGAQIGPMFCADQGAICTLLSRCCDGLSCATSAINPSYGICVPGDGGVISSGTTLISPFGGSAVDEGAGLTQTDATAATTDSQTEREARLAQIRARKDAKRSKRKTRLDSKRSAQQLRKDERHDQKLDNDEPESDPVSPQLQLRLMRTTQDDSKTTDVTEVPVDTVIVKNLGDVDIALIRIESLLTPQDGTDLTTSPSTFKLAPGKTYSFVAGLTSTNATKKRLNWLNVAVCNRTPGDGYLVKAAFSINSTHHDYEIRCDGPHTIRFGA